MKNNLTIGVVGLGLIGGSLAKAIKEKTSHTVFGGDIEPAVLKKAIDCGAIDGRLDEKTIPNCNIIFIALYPKQTIAFVNEHISNFAKGTVICDLCGIKREVCTEMFKLCAENGVTFIGGHPMAGREFSGFDYSVPTLFEGASLIITPPAAACDNEADEISRAVELIDGFAREVGFRCLKITTPENHDRMIAYTSQLAHVLSNAYVKSPRALEHEGFSAGSFKDLTRVAKLNEEMWTELFFENKDNLLNELMTLIEHLGEYKTALENNDAPTLKALLKDGRLLKEQLM